MALKGEVPGIYERSPIHTITLSTQNNRYIQELKSVIKKYPMTWKTTEEQEITNAIQPRPAYLPAERLQTPPKKWEETLQSIYLKKHTPNFIKEVNFFILHNIVSTKIFKKNKFNLMTGKDNKCRICKEEAEDLRHILTTCKQIKPLLKHLKTTLSDTTDLQKKILFYSHTIDIDDFNLISWYRYTVITLWKHPNTHEPWEYIFNFNWDRS